MSNPQNDKKVQYSSLTVQNKSLYNILASKLA